MDSGGAWAPGVSVGRYSLLAKLATGGMAEIWLARQNGLRGFERTVVIKRILESLSNDEAFVEMFLDEARIAVQLTHPNVVQVYDLGEHAGAYYLAMEYLAGENLATVARAAARAGQQLDPDAAVKLIIWALEGLAYAHTRTGVDGRPLRIVHRDISPQNIMLTWNGQVKLVDFGIARAANRATQTQNQQLKGKFAYMAPEQAQGGLELDARADVFSMGVVLWELVTRKRLHATDDSVQILRGMLSPDAFPEAHAKNPQVPADLSVILARALEKDRDHRWPDAQHFKAALEGWLRSRGGGPGPADFEAVMHTLFEARIAERQQLIEQAAAGVTPDAAALKPTTQRTMPGQTSLLSRHGRLVALLLGALGLLGVASAFTWRQFAAPVAPGEPRAPSAVLVEADVPHAEVWIDGVLRGPSPLTVELPPGDHVVEARAAAHQPVQRSVTVKGEGGQLMLVLSLPPAAPPDAGEVKVAVDVLPVDPAPKPVEPVQAAPARGKLSLRTEPWTHVTLNGRSLGDTPLLELPLPAGRHLLQLQNPQEHVDTAIEVEVKAGQVTKKVLRL